jgi:hypothetical protein
VRLASVVLFMAAISFPAAVHAAVGAEGFALETSWASSAAGAIASNGTHVWVVSTNGAQVTQYDASGTEVATWETNRPGGPTDVFDRAIGIDGAGLVFVMTATRGGSWVQKFRADGTLVSAEPFATPPDLGFAVDASGNVHGGDDAFDARILLLALGEDGTRYLSDLDSDQSSVYALGPGHDLVPGGRKCRGPAGHSCFDAYFGDVTQDRLYLSGSWCDASGSCGYFVRAFGPEGGLKGTIPQDALSPIAVGSSGVVYVLANPSVIEKWVPTGVTPANATTWGGLKLRWR